jgi:hypothetical protein
MRIPLRLPLLAASAVLALSASDARAQRDFEGVITMRVAAGTPQQGPRAQELEYLVRGRKLRMNMAGAPGGMAILALPAEKKLFMLMSAQNAYMEVPMQEGAAEAQAMAQGADVKVTRTGRKETIAGYECEHILVTSQKETADICMARGLGSYVNPMSAMRAGSEPAWQKMLSNEGFPLRVTGPDGVVAMEVTKVEKKRLDNALFSVPEHYSRMQVPQRR